MKLSRAKVLEIIRRKNDGWSSYQARKIAGISTRRVDQIYKHYLETGKPPIVGRAMGRPTRPITPQERTMIDEAYKRYRVCADTLEKLIERDYGVHISHNHIHKVMVDLGHAKQLKKTHTRKKKWIRYERRHSLTAVHIDWHQRPNDGIWVLAIIDDASRKMLALTECESATTDESIQGMELALEHGTIRQCISDHGCQFTTNNGGESRFRDWLDANAIKQILCRIKHPQSNGKVEKWFQIYENHRDAFNTIEEFLHWYNEIRPHRALKFDILETPEMAFQRKMKAEV